MAAPIQKKPHHVRRELCTTRPPYRQGRELKAVKVYTVNQESKYLLIQGVPALGAQQELVKLCALYGTVEEYRLLDEYPAEEYTEVFWIKFQSLHSARIAKRKLDDFSLFGGILHVCYAPEFESVQETREKLQERRKSVAFRVRKLETENEQRLASAGIPSASSTSREAASAVIHKRHDLAQSHVKTNTQYYNESHAQSTSRVNISRENEVNQIPAAEEKLSPAQEDWPPPLSLPPPPPKYPPPWHHDPTLYGETVPQQYPWAHHPSDQGHPRIHQIVASPSGHSTFRNSSAPSGGYAKVPSAQAAFPQDYDARLPDKTSHPRGSNTEPKTNPAVFNGETLHQDQRKEGEIVKNYKVPKSFSKFVPRQVSKKSLKLPPPGKDLTADKEEKLVPKSESEPEGKKVDSVNENLKKEAFVLRSKCGPQLPPTEEERRCTFKQTETGSESVDQTVQAIRKRVQEFSTVAPPPQLKRKKLKH